MDHWEGLRLQPSTRRMPVRLAAALGLIARRNVRPRSYGDGFGTWVLELTRILMACVVFGPAAFAEPVTLQWAHAYEPVEIYHQQALMVAEKIQRDTNNRVRIQVVPSGKLGPEPTYPKLLAEGKLDMCYCGLAMLGQDYPPLALSHYPFAFRDIEHVRRYLGSPLLDELMQGYRDKTGNVVLAGFYYGARHVTSNVAVSDPDAFKGKHVRIPGAEAYRVFVGAVGADAVMMPLSSVYDALKDKKIDMQENPLPTIKNRRFYEVQKYVALTAHIYDIIGVVVSKSAWAKISEADAQIVRRHIKEAAMWTSIGVIGQELVEEDVLRARGMTLLRVDRAAFRDRIRKYRQPAELGIRAGDYERLQALAPK